MFNKILVVCVGNICRSPTAERLLKQYHPQITVESAGLGALVGKGADAAAMSVAAGHQLSLEGHCARQVTGRLCRDYDLITAMEKGISPLCTNWRPRCVARSCSSVTGTTSAKFPTLIAKAARRLKRCTHYLNGLLASGRRH